MTAPTPIRNLIVLCTGNVCRSPMAEAVLARDLGEGWHVESAGLGALVGHPAVPEACAAAAKGGLDLSRHVARQVDESMLRRCELALVRETRQKDDLESRHPWMRGRVFRLGHWEKYDIDDPYRRPQEVFDRTFALIETCSRSWLPFLNRRNRA